MTVDLGGFVSSAQNCKSDPPGLRTGGQCLMDRFADRALRILLVMIAAAILVVAARSIMFPGSQCSAGTYPAEHCALAPGF
jgi:hypothetical protein